MCELTVQVHTAVARARVKTRTVARTKGSRDAVLHIHPLVITRAMARPERTGNTRSRVRTQTNSVRSPLPVMDPLPGDLPLIILTFPRLPGGDEGGSSFHVFVSWLGFLIPTFAVLNELLYTTLYFCECQCSHS